MELFICSYCGSNRKNKNSWANHERTCPLNANRKYKNGMLGKKGTNQYIKSKQNSLPNPVYDTSKRPRSGFAIASSEQKSKWAKEAGTGGYKPNAGRSKKYKVNDSFGKEVVLQSSYELLCSEILDAKSIKWIRPKALKYDGRNYFADFFLVDFNIYLDPKNDYKAKLDKQKIESVIKENNVIVHILTKDMINEEYITMLVSPNGEGLS